MDTRTISTLPIYAVRSLLLHLAATEGSVRVSDVTVTAVNCSHATWGKCLEAFDELAVDKDSASLDVYYWHLSLGQFLDESTQAADGVLVLSLDTKSYLNSRTRIVDCIDTLSRRPHVSVVLVCADDDVFHLLMDDLYPQVHWSLDENSPPNDFKLLLTVLLRLDIAESSFGSIDVSEMEYGLGTKGTP